MKTTLSVSDFRDAFIRMERKNQFSYQAYGLIYDFLEEEYYEHDFNDLQNQNREEDMKTYGLADMHEVRKELKNTAPRPIDILSPYVLEKCNGMDFWRINPHVQTLPKYINTSKNQIQIVK